MIFLFALFMGLVFSVIGLALIAGAVESIQKSMKELKRYK